MQCILPLHMLDVIKLRGDAKMKKMVASLEREAEKARQARQDAAPAEAFRGVAAAAFEIDA